MSFSRLSQKLNLFGHHAFDLPLSMTLFRLPFWSILPPDTRVLVDGGGKVEPLCSEMLDRYNVLPSLFITRCTLDLVLSNTNTARVELRTALIWTVYKGYSLLYHQAPYISIYNPWSCLLLVILTALPCAFFLRFHKSQSIGNDFNVFGDGTLRPFILPCRTTHTRLFPKKHGFSYSYLQAGIPVGWRGSIASMLSADMSQVSEASPRSTTKAWFSIEAADYLDKGNSQLGLRGKLDVYLESQGECKEHYPKAYLVTAPRFLGYSFNPVSFWYLYSEDLRLKAMILEVNNTFDERRMYFMKQTLPSESSEDEVKKDCVPRFTNHWAKDFHVSPFNSRNGSYSLTASDLFANPNALNVDNTITLSSSKDHAKLIARIFSTGPPVDPYTMTLWAKIHFILSWWWVGFLTFPRIVKEAGRLFFRRKLHVWFRPEVYGTSIGRNESHRER